MSQPKPSVDLGYPTEAHGRIPAFQSIQEEAAFWDTHSTTDFADELQPVRVGRNLPAPLAVRLGPRGSGRAGAPGEGARDRSLHAGAQVGEGASAARSRSRDPAASTPLTDQNI